MMYTITRGPSKLVTQRRTGPTQQIENKTNDLKHKQTTLSVTCSPTPKLVFNRLNGKRYHSPPTPLSDTSAEGFTAAHEENVRFVHEAWLEVTQQLRGGAQPEQGEGPVQYTEKPEQGAGPVQDTEKAPSPLMKNFVPIDLEEWWAQRFLANIANLS